MIKVGAVNKVFFFQFLLLISTSQAHSTDLDTTNFHFLTNYEKRMVLFCDSLILKVQDSEGYSSCESEICQLAYGISALNNTRSYSVKPFLNHFAGWSDAWLSQIPPKEFEKVNNHASDDLRDMDLDYLMKIHKNCYFLLKWITVSVKLNIAVDYHSAPLMFELMSFYKGKDDFSRLTVNHWESLVYSFVEPNSDNTIDRYEDAIQFCDKILDTCSDEETEDLFYFHRCKFVNNLTNLKKLISDLDYAFSAYLNLESEILSHQKKSNHKNRWEILLGVVYGSLAEVSFSLGKLELAKDYYEKLFNLKLLPETVHLSHQMKYAMSFVASRDWREADELLSKSLTRAISLGNNALARRAANYLRQIYARRKNFDKYHEMTLKYDSLGTLTGQQSSFANKDFLDTRQSLTNKLLAQEKLNVVNEKKISELSKKWNIILSAIVVLLILSAGLFFVLTKLSRKWRELRQKNEAIAEAMSTKDKINTTQNLQIEGYKKLKEKIFNTIENNATLSDEAKAELIFKLEKTCRQYNPENILTEFESAYLNLDEDLDRYLSEKYPSLTKSEKRLLCFFRLQLTIDEICDLTGKSSSAVRTAKSRIRSKLEITDKNISLDIFLNEIEVKLNPQENPEEFPLKRLAFILNPEQKKK